MFIKSLMSGMHQNAKKVSQESKRAYLTCLADIIWCGIVYGASPNNYNKFDFYRIDATKRATYVTNRISNRMIQKYNHPDYRPLFEDKDVFAEKFSDVFRRDWLLFPNCTQQAYKSFVANKSRFICKPLDGSQGLGIEVIDGHIPSYQELVDRLSGNSYILEEYIVQHEALDAYYADAINCIRIITVLKNGKVYPVVANITFSAGHQIANASFGGITCEIDISTGEVVTDGGAYGHQLYKNHPCTNVPFKGFVIPYWDKILTMLDDIGSRIPEVGYVGWDVAIAQDGPIVIEGNTSPGYTFFQIPQLLPNQIGVMDKYAPFLD